MNRGSPSLARLIDFAQLALCPVVFDSIGVLRRTLLKLPLSHLFSRVATESIFVHFDVRHHISPCESHADIKNGSSTSPVGFVFRSLYVRILYDQMAHFVTNM